MSQDFSKKLEAATGTLEDLLESVQAEIVRLLKERESIDINIASLQEKITSLSAVLGVYVEDPIFQLGLTDAIRHIVGMSRHPMTAGEIKDRLLKAGFNLPKDGPLAPVYTITKRLEKSGEIEKTDAGYQWTNATLVPPPFMPEWMREDRTNKSKTLIEEIRGWYKAQAPRRGDLLHITLSSSLFGLSLGRIT